MRRSGAEHLGKSLDFFGTSSNLLMARGKESMTSVIRCVLIAILIQFV
jgi:hypothetical protein